MAFSELYVCDSCEADVVLVHAEEWGPGPDGKMLTYSGSGPVGGLLNRVWCPGCRAVRPFAFVTLKPYGDHAVVAYAEAQRLGCDGTETGPCPVCRTPLTWIVNEEICPKCEKGHLRFTGEWEDAL